MVHTHSSLRTQGENYLHSVDTAEKGSDCSSVPESLKESTIHSLLVVSLLKM